MSAPAWKALVPPGERRLACRAAIDAIAGDLARARTSVREPSLARGSAGLAATFAYLAQCVPGRAYEQVADELLDRAIEQLSDAPLLPGLFGGYAGVAWSYAQLAPLLYEDAPAEDALADIEQALLEVLEEASPRLSHELISGMAGIAVYAIGRADRPVPRTILERTVGILAARAEHVGDGLTWPTLPTMRPPRAQAVTSYNLGVSHGVPGTLGALAGTIAAGVDVERARPLLAGGLRWLFAQVHAAGPVALDYEIVPGEPAVPSRLAWCYGEAGASVTLLEGARVLGEPAYADRALELGRRAARRTAETSGVVDAGLCHGAVGLAHVFNRLWQASGEALFEQAALEWLDRGLAQRGARGPGGFAAWTTPATGEDVTGFLEGAAGVALALAAATGDVDPWWDVPLLLSLPRLQTLG